MGNEVYLQIIEYEPETPGYFWIKIPNPNTARKMFRERPIVFLARKQDELVCLACTKVIVCSCGRNPQCVSCHGHGLYEEITGGYVTTRENSEAVSFIKWRHRRKKSRIGVEKAVPCQTCGGTGSIIRYRVYGAYQSGDIYCVGREPKYSDIKSVSMGEANTCALLPSGWGGDVSGYHCLVKGRGNRNRAIVELLEGHGIKFDIIGDYAKIKSPVAHVAKFWPGLKKWSLPEIGDDSVISG